MCLGFQEIAPVQHRKLGRRSMTDRTNITPTNNFLPMSVRCADVIPRKDGQSPSKT